MSDVKQKTDVLITVMTYPHPSKGYKELICTAGITRNGDWVRLYPIDYRYRPKKQQFRKYQWISVDLSVRGKGNDKRKESREPVLDTIEVLEPPISTDNSWAERRKLIDTLPHHSVKEYKDQYDKDETSLGIVRPSRIIDMVFEETDRHWKPEWEASLAQIPLFGEQQKPLKKLPYKFSYIFECHDSTTPHKTMCEDWELGVLFFKEVDRLGSEEKAAESVRNKFFNEICSAQKDTSFFMGTIFPYNTWVVLGVFYPPKIDPLDPVQLSLF